MNKSFTRQGWFKDTFVINIASTLAVLTLAVIAIFFSPILSMVIIGVGIIFVPLMLLFSVFFARVIKNPSLGIVGWIVSIVITWALTAPISSWMDNTLIAADPNTHSYGPQEFNSALWYWALIPAVIYLIIGIMGRSKIFTKLFDKSLEFFFKILE